MLLEVVEAMRVLAERARMKKKLAGQIGGGGGHGSKRPVGSGIPLRSSLTAGPAGPAGRGDGRRI